MWQRLVKHFEESRIYKRDINPYLELKRQTNNLFTRVIIHHPLKLSLEVDYDKKGLSHVIRHPRFCPQCPFHFEIDTTKTMILSSCFSMPNNMKYIGKLLNDKVKTTISFYSNQMKNLSTAIKLDYDGRFGFGWAFKPNSFAFNIFGKNHGFEFLWNFVEIQPSFSYMFNKIFNKTEVTALAMMYGNVALLTTTYFKEARVSTFYEMNVFTLTANTAFGIAMPFKDSSVSLSYNFNTNSFIAEVAINKAEDDMKSGVTAFLPISLPSKPEK